MRRLPEVAVRVVPGEGGARAAGGPRVFMAQEISPVPCYPQGQGNKKHNNKQGVMMMSEDEKRITEATNDRLRARLKTVAALAENALANQPYGIDTCWEHLVGALGRIETEMLIHTAEKPGGNPPAEAQSRREEKPWKPLEMPECGIDFRRYRSAECDAFICAWDDGSHSHVYEVRCRKVEEGKWAAVLSNDGRKLCTLSAASRQLAYRLALGAMRNYLRRGHRKTIRRFAEKAARSDAATPQAPSTKHQAQGTN